MRCVPLKFCNFVTCKECVHVCRARIPVVANMCAVSVTEAVINNDST